MAEEQRPYNLYLVSLVLQVFREESWSYLSYLEIITVQSISLCPIYASEMIQSMIVCPIHILK